MLVSRSLGINVHILCRAAYLILICTRYELVKQYVIIKTCNSILTRVLISKANTIKLEYTACYSC